MVSAARAALIPLFIPEQLGLGAEFFSINSGP
jgi:hypothetical protein